MRNRIMLRRVLRGPTWTFGLLQIFKSNVVNFMLLVQAFDGFKCSDLPAARGRMQKIGFDPKYFQATAAGS